jgi:hypothetical protein
MQFAEWSRSPAIREALHLLEHAAARWEPESEQVGSSELENSNMAVRAHHAALRPWNLVRVLHRNP